MDLKFSNALELYDLLLPALETKEIQLRRNDYLGITKKDIWKYLSETRWKNYNGLRLYQMVSDIFNLDSDLLNNYIKK